MQNIKTDLSLISIPSKVRIRDHMKDVEEANTNSSEIK
jgi:hypothetical protein